MDSGRSTTSRTGRRATKAFHHKSRKGCRTCKSRRVKCDERQPACSNCERIGKFPCIYDAPKTPPRPGQRSNSTDNGEADPIEVKSDPESDSQLVSSLHRLNSLDLPESKARRMMELRLQHNFIVHITDPFPHLPSSRPVTAWSSQVPLLALEHDNVQYLMFLCSAAHLLRNAPDNQVVAAHRMYRMLSLREQQKAVAKLSIENCDAVCSSAMLLFLDAFTSLWSRVIEPYTPPIEWLKIGSGVGAVLNAAMVMLSEHYTSLSSTQSPRAAREQTPEVMLLRTVPPPLVPEELFSKENLAPFRDLVDSSPELADAETREAYENALSYIGSVHYAVCNGEPIYCIARRLASFAIFVPRKFIDFVDEQRPRALVILAHYFAVMTKAQSVWWISNTPQREIQAIQRAVPAEWQDSMRWPMVAAGLSPA